MLYEQQAAELLRRCEEVAGRRLKHVRANLKRASTRAEAVWEMLVLEAASHVGKVECERPEGGPDIRLQMPSGRWVSIEVTYVHARFDDEETRWRNMIQWFAEEEQKIGPVRVAIEFELSGKAAASGTRISLPGEHERKSFIRSPEVSHFLATVRQRPNERHRTKLEQYDLTLFSRPRISDADRFSSSSGPVLENPTTIGEHAAYRALRAKIAQHRKVDEPYVVCIGSDSNRVLTGGDFLGITLQDALRAALRQSARVSAVLVVTMKSDSFGSAASRHLESMLYRVPGCRHPLTDEEAQVLCALNLNRWRYSYPLPTREAPPDQRRVRIGGRLDSTGGIHGMKLTIPSSALVDVLAGRASLFDKYGGDGDNLDDVMKCLREGWDVVGCRFIESNIEKAESARVELELAPPHESVFWGKDSPPTSPGRKGT